MTTCAIIPVKGRLPLLEITIKRLIISNSVDCVVCVGATSEEHRVSVSAGADFLYHDNYPLGRKWNAGFQYAATRYNPDAYVFVGSSDWLSNNWLDETLPYLSDYDMIGKPDFYLLDVQPDLKRACHWGGYTEVERINEPIGIGRILSRSILEQLDFTPFDNNIDKSLDWSMYQKVLAKGGRIKNITGEHIKSLSISHYNWTNKHRFDDHWYGTLPSERIEVSEIEKEFKEAGELI